MNIPHTFNQLGYGKKSELPPGFKPLDFYGPMNNTSFVISDIKAQYDDTYRLIYKNDKWSTSTLLFNWYNEVSGGGFGVKLGYFDGDFVSYFFGMHGMRSYGSKTGVWHEVELGPVDDTRYYYIIDGQETIRDKPEVTWNPNKPLIITNKPNDIFMKEFELLRNGERVCKLLPAINPAGEKCIVDIVTGKTYKPT